VDLMLVRALRRRTGFLITTRAGYNLMAAQLRPPGLILIGQEHMNLARQPRPLREEMRRVYGHLHVLTVLTDADRAAYEEWLGGVVSVVRVPNGIQTAGAARCDPSSRTVLSAGRLTPQKGYDMLIAAWAQLAAGHPDWRLLICGAGPKRPRLEGLVEQHGLGEVVTIAPPSKQLAREMERASVYALSSRFEGLPLVLLEAMAHGMAVVSFDCPTGPADLIDHGRNGLLVPPRDVGALAAALARMMESEELRRSCGAAAVETAQRYGVDAIGAMWDSLLERLESGAPLVAGAAEP
jgi:glycosyltransferase involved in cell wall biosynthesis